MNNFKLYVPTKIYWGRNILFESLKKEQNIIKGNVLVVSTGRSLTRLGYLDELIKILRDFASVNDVFLYSNISANPRLSEINKAVELAQNKKVDIIIGFGGGSSIDAAKVVAASVGMAVSPQQLFENAITPDENTLPIIAIPTTAGTGSELSKAAIVTDDVAIVKGGIRGERLYPQVAIVDSIYTESIPLNITMETGFDVLAHAMESYVSKASNEITKMLSREVISIVGTYLPLLKLDLNNIEARKKMSYASMLMGINLGNASTALPHRLQYPLGAHTDKSHGLCLAMMYPSWIKYEYDIAPDKTSEMLDLLINKTPNNRDEAIAYIEAFIANLGIDGSLGDIGITTEMIGVLKSEVSGSIANDPIAEIDGIIEKIYMESL